MAEIIVDVTGEKCPIPLVQMRKAVKKAEVGDVVEISGDNEASKKEISMAAEALTLVVESIEENNGIWKIRIKK